MRTAAIFSCAELHVVVVHW